jgi:hypothetical protein
VQGHENASQYHVLDVLDTEIEQDGDGSQNPHGCKAGRQSYHEIIGENGGCGHRVVHMVHKMNCGADVEMNFGVVAVLSFIV